MSGGSYDYLCWKEAGEILECEATIQQMADRLARLGYANDAAKETQLLLLEIRQAKNRLNVSIERLQNVWQAIEWWDSGDSSEKELQKALAFYRKEVA